jgi:hypothetical protein
MKKQAFFLIMVGILCLTNQYASAQVSGGGEPISFSIDMGKEEIPVLVMASVNVDSLLQEDESADKINSQRPFKFGHAIDVSIDIKKSGMEKRLPSGDRLWLLKIHSPNAFSLNLIYNQFRLGNGSKFFVYNEDKTTILGAFTPELNNNPHNEFATDLVAGNTIVLEFYEPKSSNGGIIHINKVIHGYIDTFSNGLGTSAPCNIDVNCSLGYDWDNEKRAVSMMLTNENTAFCTGCLVNNTEQNRTPYYLTANHCVESGNPNTWIFRFQYWRPNCGSGNPSSWVSITGSTLRAKYAPTDFALLELHTTPPSSFNISYAGWDRTPTAAQGVTGIHHPRGDAMKISHATGSVTAVPWKSGNANHWRTTFNQGIVQPSSSGSPLFNQYHRIIGQLHGNQNNQCNTNDNNCFCAQTPIGEYGRFDISWTGGGTNSTRLSNWLDPFNTGVSVLDGCNGVVNYSNTTVTGNVTITSCDTLSVQNVTVQNGARLTLEAKQVNITEPFNVQNGAEFIINVSP